MAASQARARGGEQQWGPGGEHSQGRKQGHVSLSRQARYSSTVQMVENQEEVEASSGVVAASSAGAAAPSSTRLRP